MKATVRASTGAKIVVWRDGEMFKARLADTVAEAQICLGVDLFEVIADLSGLDLEVWAQATEAVALAERVQQQLGDGALWPDNESPAPGHKRRHSLDGEPPG
jgi:hypothetical protein